MIKKLSIFLLFCFAFQALAQELPSTLDKTLDSLQKKSGHPGFSIAWLDSGKLQSVKYYGTGPFSQNSAFRAGSISKSFVAFALLLAEAEGKLNLQDPISKWVDDVEVKNRHKTPIKIVNLLEHTAGFDDMRVNEMYRKPGEDISLQYALSVNPRSRMVRWEPGTIYSYSNPGYTLAALILERATSMPYHEYIRLKIFEPLGMRSSSFFPGDSLLNRLAQGTEGDKTVSYKEIYHAPSGNLVTTASDLAQWVQLLMNTGKINGTQVFDSLTILKMFQRESSTAANLGMKNGYAKGILVSHDSQPKSFWHNGAIDGFCGEYKFFPDNGKGYVVLFRSSNGEKGISKVEEALHKAASNETKTPIQTQTLSVNFEKLHFLKKSIRNSAMRGFEIPFSGSKLEVEKDFLIYKSTSKDDTLYQIAANGNTIFLANKYSSDAIAILFMKEDGSYDLEYQNDYFSSISGTSFFIRSTLFKISIFLMVLLTLIGLTMAALSLVKKRYRLFPLWLSIGLPGLGLILMIAMQLAAGDYEKLSRPTGYSITVFLASLLPATVPFAGLWWIIKDKKNLKLWEFIVFGILITILVSIALHFWFFGLAGMRTWI